jgi:hypothetical protein
MREDENGVVRCDGREVGRSGEGDGRAGGQGWRHGAGQGISFSGRGHGRAGRGGSQAGGRAPG